MKNTNKEAWFFKTKYFLQVKTQMKKTWISQMARNERNACGIATQASYPVVWAWQATEILYVISWLLWLW